MPDIDPELRKKLERLGVVAGRDFAPKPKRDISEFIPGKVISNDQGEFFHTQTAYHRSHQHGHGLIEPFFEIDSHHLVHLANDPSLVEYSAKDLLFIDTETTGLSGGTGTYAFLIGIGYVQEDHFIIEQLFLRSYQDEPAMLQYLYDVLKRFKVLVSYNGKTFDIPLLTSRFVMNRIPPKTESMTQLDLLHPARRIWKNRVTNCSLATLEAELFGIHRTDDISGALIPTQYFHYQRTGDGSLMQPVIYHNRIDVLSMVNLTIRLHNIFAETDADELDNFQAGRLLTSRGHVDEGIRRLEASLTEKLTGLHYYNAAKELATQYKKINRWEDAVRIWQELICKGYLPDEYPHIELAKYFEHIAKDNKTALHWTEEALKLLGPFETESKVELLHRQQRLTRKLGIEDA